MKWVLTAALCLGSLELRATWDHEAEYRFRPEYARLATGILGARNKTHPWPVKILSIGHTMASYQHYLSTGGYFHQGLDIRADSGSPVVAAAGGKVINIQNYETGDAYWEVAIRDDEGFIWQYHHVEPSSIPQAIHNALKTGAPIAEGTKIGEVYHWSVMSFGEYFHHVHVNVIGAGGNFVDPMALLEPLSDHRGPEILEIGLMKNFKKLHGAQVSGAYSLYAHVTDLILHDKFIVPPYSLTLEIDGKAPVTVWQFDSLPGGTNCKDFVHAFFVKSLACGNYICRKPVINLGFSKTGNPVFPTERGNHRVKVTASDRVGNRTQREFSWTVR